MSTTCQHCGAHHGFGAAQLEGHGMMKSDPNIQRIADLERQLAAARSMLKDQRKVLIEAGELLDKDAIIADLERQLRKRDNAIAIAYGYLWHVNNEPGTPQQYPPERAAYGARKALRDLLNQEQRGYAINAVRGLIETELLDYEARKPK